MTDKFFSPATAAIIEKAPTLDQGKQLALEAIAMQPNARKLNSLRANMAISACKTRQDLLIVVWGFMMSYDGYKVLK